jgi:hypothetical protein
MSTHGRLPIILLATLRSEIKITYLIYQDITSGTHQGEAPCVSSQSLQQQSQSQLCSQPRLRPSVLTAARSNRMANAGTDMGLPARLPGDFGNRARSRPAPPQLNGPLAVGPNVALRSFALGPAVLWGQLLGSTSHAGREKQPEGIGPAKWAKRETPA